jgi:hypothetical protein
MKKNYLLLILCVLFFNVIVSASTKKAGFLNVAASVSAIADDDEKAAAQWFTTTYGGDYIPVSQIGTIDLSQYGVLWIYADNESGYADAPDAIYAVAGVLTDYYKAGGNLLLSIYANNLLYEFGRTDMWPNIVGGAGPGAVNPDVWSLSTAYGTWDPTKTVFDRSGDPLFTGLTTESVTRGNGSNYITIPFIGNGWKEDHNCFWTMDIADAGLPNDNSAKLTTWESTHNVTTLGTWGHVQDYFGSAISRWKPTDVYRGTCITIGIGGYEWKIKDGTNPYQANIERLTKNALDEMKSPASALNSIQELGIKLVVVNNVLTIPNAENIAKGQIYNVNGQILKSFEQSEIKTGINVSDLTKGMYIIKLIDSTGKALAADKFIL